MTAAITGIGWVTGGGHGWGSSGRLLKTGDGPLSPLTRKDVFPEPNQRFGRQSAYSRLGLAAIAFALRDAGLEQWSEKRPVGIVAASQLGCLATDLDYYHTVLPAGGGLPSPNLFAYTLANCFMGEAAIQFGLTGSTQVINPPDQSGLDSLRLALESIAWGEHDTMLAGICDLPAPAAVRDSVDPMPGALFMVLTRSPAVKDSGYGSLAFSEEGALLHNGSGFTDIIALARTCLTGR